MKDERPCLDSLDRHLDQCSPSRPADHSCPECADLPQIVDRLRHLETACGQPDDDALARAVMEKARHVLPVPRPKAWLLPVVLTAALIGGALWYGLRSTPVSSESPAALKSPRETSPASSAVSLTATESTRGATRSSLLPPVPVEPPMPGTDKRLETASPSSAVANENASTIEIKDPDGIPR